jgi:hypothetical protein
MACCTQSSAPGILPPSRAFSAIRCNSRYRFATTRSNIARVAAGTGAAWAAGDAVATFSGATRRAKVECPLMHVAS